MERWKPIPSCPKYDASDTGRIRRRSSGLILKPKDNGSGYLFVDLSRRTRYINRLVCEAFHGSPQRQNDEAAHLNGNRADNAASNLRWKTRVENEADKLAHGTRINGSKSNLAYLTEQAVSEIRRLRSELRMPYAEIAADYGVDKSTVGMIVRRETWKHIP